jgi:MFS family permease
MMIGTRVEKTKGSSIPHVGKLDPLLKLAPGLGFEPRTDRLTADCSTAELPRNGRGAIVSRRRRGRPAYVDLRLFSTALDGPARKWHWRGGIAMSVAGVAGVEENGVSEGDFAALDEQDFAAFHWRTTFVTGLGVFCDGYDLSSVGIVLPLILASFGDAKLSSIESASLAASALLGSTLGALVFGVLAQRGRRRFYGWDVLILGVTAVAQAFAPNLAWLIAIRFLLGIGVGADYVLSPTIMAEHANRDDRGRALGLGFGTMWPLGALVAALLTLILDAVGTSPDLQWRLVLAAGAIPALAVIYFRRQMPETARFLARIAGDRDAAAQVIAEISGAAGVAPAADERGFGEVLARHGRAIFSAALLWMIYDLVVYAGVLFGPSLIASSLGLGPVAFSLLLDSIFILPASVLMSLFLIDRIGRKPLQVWGFVIGGAFVAVFALMQSRLAAVPILAFTVFGLYCVAQTGPGIVSGAGVLGVELAPTRIRSVAQSITVAGGRIGAAISAFFFPLLFAGIGQAGAYWVIAALAVCGAILTQLLVPETGRISLEGITETQPARPRAAP